MSNNYPTSYRKMLLRRLYRFVVEYEDGETQEVLNFEVQAPTASVAIARTTAFIDNEKINTTGTYYLIPRVVNKEIEVKIDYYID